MRLLASIFLLCFCVTILGCGSGTGAEMPEDPDPMPTEEPLSSEQPAEVSVD
jgi:hypothetical protein